MQKAKEMLRGAAELKIEWKPFLLDESTPIEGYDLKEYLVRKYGERVLETFGKADSPLMRAGRKCNIKFNMARRFARSLESHVLLEHALSKHGSQVQTKLAEELFKAYFEEAADIGSLELLGTVYKRSGLNDWEDVLASIKNGDGTHQVLIESHKWKRQGVHGVPFFIVQEEDCQSRPVAFSGAQPPEVIVDVVQDILKDSSS